jgi:hypothetical protein
VGDEYPSAQILGIDLSPIQPVWVPPNVKFMVDDAESSWLEPENFYDLIHARHVTQAFKDFPTLLQRAYRYIHSPFFLTAKFYPSLETGRNADLRLPEQTYQARRLD